MNYNFVLVIFQRRESAEYEQDFFVETHIGFP